MQQEQFTGTWSLPSQHLFEKEFSKEILESEKLRATILSTIFICILAYYILITVFFREQLERLFQPGFSRYWIAVFLGAVSLQQFAVRHAIGWRIRTKRGFPFLLRYWNAFVDTTIPTVGIILFSYITDPLNALNMPAMFAYFIFIILSTLRLDFKLCAFTGFVAAAEYLAISLFYIAQAKESTVGALLQTELVYYSRGGILLGSGIIAGLVAVQIKKRVLRSIEALEERNQIVNLFGQQVSQEIVDELLQHAPEAKGIPRYVCVMFLDIRRFTQFVEQKQPHEVVAYLDSLFSFMIEIINRHHGIINQFVGDGFMATFGAPLSQGNDRLSAVQAAVDILERLQQECTKGTIPPTRIGIGLHAGIAVTGNVGTSLRKQYSITGDVVVLASRIEQLNKEFQSQLLVSEEVWNGVRANGYNAEPLGQAHIKGWEHPLTVFKLA